MTSIDSDDSMTDLPDMHSLSVKDSNLPADLQYCRQVAEVVLPECLMKIFYNDVLHSPFVQFYEDWSYFGNANTTFQELLTHFGIIDPIITWIESPYDMDDFSLNYIISQSPAVMLEFDEEHEGRY
jgi:hypothetical protein